MLDGIAQIITEDISLFNRHDEPVEEFAEEQVAELT
jgi:hypothetical protein